MLLRILSDHGLLAFCLIGVHDVRHIEGGVLSQPGVDNQVLLNIGLSAGVLNQVSNLITGSLDSIAIESDTQSVAVHEVLDHAGQIIIGHVAGADNVHGNAGQNQHFTQDTQAISAIVVVGQEEGGLNTQDVSIGFPVVQVLLVHIQHILDLLLGQRHGIALCVQNSHVLQLFGDGDNGGIGFVDLNIGISHHHRSGELNTFNLEGRCSLGFSLDRSFHSGGFSSLGFDNCCGSFHGFGSLCGNRNQTEDHAENQQHAENTHCVLFHLVTSFRKFFAHGQ